MNLTRETVRPRQGRWITSAEPHRRVIARRSSRHAAPLQAAALLTVLLLILLWSSLPLQAQVFHPAPVAPRDFALMAWGTSPASPARLREMREAGLNISGFCAPQDVKKVAAAGLSCFVSDPRVNGYSWDHMPPAGELQNKIAAAVDAVKGDPAVLGFFLRDEPSAAFFPGLGEAAAMLKKAAPGKWSYVNLFPTYASQSQLGAGSYEQYVEEYIRLVHPPFLSYDNYSLRDGRMGDAFYTNLEIIRRLSLQAGIPFWNVVLSDSLFNYMDPSDATLRLQVYSTLAYGGRGVSYFTYFNPDVGNFRMAPIDAFGHRTATWFALRRVNNEVNALAPWLTKLHSTGVYHSAPVPPQSKPLSDSRLVESVTAHGANTTPPFFIGEFEDENGASYLMLVNEDLEHSMSFEIKLRQTGAKLDRISPYSGKEQPLAGEMNWLAPGAGVLLRVAR